MELLNGGRFILRTSRSRDNQAWCGRRRLYLRHEDFDSLNLED
jgi:hypothetical protein